MKLRSLNKIAHLIPPAELAKLKAGRMSALEVKFLFAWKALNGQPLVAQHQFLDDRKWAFDFAHLLTRTAIEVEGGLWGVGKPCRACKRRQPAGHQTAKGFQEDCEKYNAAEFLGWHVLRLTSTMLNVDTLTSIRDYIATTEMRLRTQVERSTYPVPDVYVMPSREVYETE